MSDFSEDFRKAHPPERCRCGHYWNDHSFAKSANGDTRACINCTCQEYEPEPETLAEVATLKAERDEALAENARLRARLEAVEKVCADMDACAGFAERASINDSGFPSAHRFEAIAQQCREDARDVRAALSLANPDKK